MGTFVDWDGKGICCICNEQKRSEDIDALREKVLNAPPVPYKENVIHWATVKTDSVERGSWGDTITQSVIVTSNLNDSKAFAKRFYEATCKRFPFNPTFCTNQHKPPSKIETLAPGKFKVSWETYHSIGD